MIERFLCAIKRESLGDGVGNMDLSWCTRMALWYIWIERKRGDEEGGTQEERRRMHRDLVGCCVELCPILFTSRDGPNALFRRFGNHRRIRSKSTVDLRLCHSSVSKTQDMW